MTRPHRAPSHLAEPHPAPNGIVSGRAPLATATTGAAAADPLDSLNHLKLQNHLQVPDVNTGFEVTRPHRAPSHLAEPHPAPNVIAPRQAPLATATTAAAAADPLDSLNHLKLQNHLQVPDVNTGFEVTRPTEPPATLATPTRRQTELCPDRPHWQLQPPLQLPPIPSTR